MSTEMIIAFVSAGVALAGASTSVWGQFRIARLRVEMEERRETKRKAEQAEAVLSRYREPMLGSAFELQSRIFNFLKLNLLNDFYRNGNDREKTYAVENSVYVIAQYLGWTEVVRRGIQFMDLGALADTRRLSELQDEICNVFLAKDLGPVFRVFRGDQRAIGERMIVEGKDGPQCMGYAAFARSKDADFRYWFDQLRKDVDTFAANPASGEKRLVGLQHALVDLIEFLDPDCARFPKKRRMKV